MPALKIFCSYPRTRSEAVAEIATQLDQMGQHVWHDRELSGGQEWWDTILDQIRGCDCFVFLLCEDALTSRACRAELDYAHATGRSILPLVVGPPVPDAVLPRYLSRLQHIEVGNVMAVARALLNLPASHPLPDPLPEPPPVPISYLDELAAVLDQPELPMAEQRDLVGALRHRLTSGEDPEAAVSLLHRLRRRPDVSAAVAQDIDNELDRHQRHAAVAPATAPVPSPPPPPPPPAGPPRAAAGAPAAHAPVSPGAASTPAPRAVGGRVAALAAAVVLAAGVVGGGIALVGRHDPSPPPPTTPPSTPTTPPDTTVDTVDISRDALPSDFGDDPVMDDLAQSCDGGDLNDCDDLYAEAAPDSNYELFGRTCGARVPLPFDGGCSTDFDPALSDAAWACNGGDPDACSALVATASPDSLYALYGAARLSGEI